MLLCNYWPNVTVIFKLGLSLISEYFKEILHTECFETKRMQITGQDHKLLKLFLSCVGATLQYGFFSPGLFSRKNMIVSAMIKEGALHRLLQHSICSVLHCLSYGLGSLALTLSVKKL